MLPVCMSVLSLFSLIQHFSVLSDSVTLWTLAHQASLCTGFSRQGSWSRLPCPPPGDLPDPGIKPASPVAPALQVDSLLLSHVESPFTGNAAAAAAAAKSLQSCPTLCNPIDGSPPGSPVPRQEHWSGLPFPSPMHESEK